MLECTHLIWGLFVGECPGTFTDEFRPYSRLEAVIEYDSNSWQVLISNRGNFVLEQCVLELRSERGAFGYRYEMDFDPDEIYRLDRFDFRNRLADAPRHLQALRVECLDSERLDILVETLEVDDREAPARRWQRLVPAFP
ncbi:MAG: hypothetical protein JJ884_06490 [Maricaulis sp.]|jgi:hypothetical protein|uniref:hypothetical protein n=1 Tax=Maricaulis sp. TaxID=1486257 RepID=UPI001B05147B|nr:hypothetical protein [Maricaulis sp.]MBO6728977.1 hypothetical protein [Maricaulis sp.]MBO6847151.1 hypothetical protein [Maricaulis sp.]MBO6876809.1 hypothetical protein [Maricaulis sp.]